MPCAFSSRTRDASLEVGRRGMSYIPAARPNLLIGIIQSRSDDMKIGLVGAGQIGGALARLA
jgi:hypothetical protein